MTFIRSSILGATNRAENFSIFASYRAWLNSVKQVKHIKITHLTNSPPPSLLNTVFGWVEFKKNEKYKKENGVEN